MSKTAQDGAARPASADRFNILIVAQAGRLAHEAVMFAESLRRFSPDWNGQLIVAEPRPDGAWDGHDTEISADHRAMLQRLGADVVPFTAKHFGAAYPQGNKIEALACLPANEPFIFFDTDTLITGPLNAVPFDFDRPSASMRREGTWPQPPLYGPGFADIWRSLYDRFGLDFDSTLDLSQPDEHWERYLYFNAGWFFGRDPQEFGDRFLNWAVAILDDPGDELACQNLDPWLDQVVLPLVVHSFGGGRPGPELAGLDGDTTCHYRNLSLLYARESEQVMDALEQIIAENRVKKLIRDWSAVKRLVLQGKGRDKIRPIFAGSPLPFQERMVRQKLRKAGWWLA